jgi:hypothetical protein
MKKITPVHPRAIGFYTHLLFSTHSLELLLAKQLELVCQHFAKYGEIDGERYWLEPLSFDRRPFACFSVGSADRPILEYQFKVDGEPALWWMSPVPVFDAVPAGNNPVTWNLPLGTSPFLPCGEVYRDRLSLFLSSEEELEDATSNVDMVVDTQRYMLIAHFDRIEQQKGNMSVASHLQLAGG